MSSIAMSYVLGLQDVTPAEKFILLVIADGMKEYFDLQTASTYAARVTGYDLATVAESIATLAYQRDYIKHDSTNGWFIDVPQTPQVRRSKERIKQPGYVYLLRSVTGHYKIGYTADPQRRQKVFAVKLPFEVEYECLIRTQDMEALENDLHDLFAAKRVGGEWFNLTEEDVKYIKGLAE